MKNDRNYRSTVRRSLTEVWHIFRITDEKQMILSELTLTNFLIDMIARRIACLFKNLALFWNLFPNLFPDSHPQPYFIKPCCMVHAYSKDLGHITSIHWISAAIKTYNQYRFNRLIAFICWRHYVGERFHMLVPISLPW